MLTRAHPVSTQMVFAISGLCWHFGLLESCCLIPVGYCCMLRTAELLDLRKSHVSFSQGKASLILSGKTGTRTGALESTVCDDAVALKLLAMLCLSKPGPEKLLNMSSYRFRRQWRWAIEQLGLALKDYQPYGLRRGGACEDFALHGDGARLCLRGRWSSVRTAKVYAEEALRIRQLASMTSDSHATIDFWATNFMTKFKEL